MKTYLDPELRFVDSELDDGFDWHEMLTSPQPDWKHMEIMSASWVTCACGSQCQIIPRYPGGMPCDYILATLGVIFDKAVMKRDAKRSLAVLGLIEKRSSDIMARAGHKLTMF